MVIKLNLLHHNFIFILPNKNAMNFGCVLNLSLYGVCIYFVFCFFFIVALFARCVLVWGAYLIRCIQLDANVYVMCAYAGGKYPFFVVRKFV